MEVYHWLGPIIGIFYITRTIYQYKKRRRSALGVVVWSSFWVAVILLSMFPDFVTVNLAELFGFKSNITAIIFVALGLLFSLVFYMSTTIERLENQVTDLVRKLAIEEANNKDKKNKKKR